MATLQFLGLLGLVLALAYFEVSILLWTAVLGISLIALTFFGSVSLLALFPIWIIFLAAAGFANLKGLRQQYFTKPLLGTLKKRLPAISQTEREALEAGDVWWEKDLFCGKPEWKKFLAIPKPELTSEEQQFIDNEVETLCGMLNDWQIVYENMDLPQDVWNFLKKNRFFGMVIPKEYGGHGFSALAHSTIVVKIATRSISAAVNTMVPNSLGPGELILHYGTTAQKDYYLPRLAKGEEIPCFALTGPDAGSDAGSITDSGVICRGEFEGKQILGIRLNWDKRYITLAPVATVLGLAFRLYDPDKLLGNKEDIGITLCLIPTNLAGVGIGNRHLPLHLAFMNGPTRGKDVFIPLDWIIGGVDMAGHGWRMLMECLSIGRSISLPALSTACGKLSYRMTGAYSRLRKQFNTSIANFEGIEEALGDIAGIAYQLDACRLLTANAIDQKVRPSTVSAIAKYHMTEMARTSIAHAMDVHAGQAIQVGPRNLFANAHISIPICITVEGANILTRNLIIFGQGAIRCHPYILSEVELLSGTESKSNLQQLDRVLVSHIGYLISNIVRNVWCGLTGGRFLKSPVSGPTARHYRQLSRMSTALALLSDVCMLLLGGDLKRKERLSARLGDMLSQLYLGSAVLKYNKDFGDSDDDLAYVEWCISQSLNKIQVACTELLNNFPNRILGKILGWIIFPFGLPYSKPQDSLCRKIVKAMLIPSAFRDRISKYCYIGEKDQDPSHRLELAFTQMELVEPVSKKFQIATRSGKVPKLGSFKERLDAAVKNNILTAEESTLLRNFETLRNEVIKVDEFSFDLSSIQS